MSGSSLTASSTALRAPARFSFLLVQNWAYWTRFEVASADLAGDEAVAVAFEGLVRVSLEHQKLGRLLIERVRIGIIGRQVPDLLEELDAFVGALLLTVLDDPVDPGIVGVRVFREAGR